MRRIPIGIFAVMVVVGSVAACAEEDTPAVEETAEVGTVEGTADPDAEQTEDPATSIQEAVNDFCNDSDEFVQDVAADPTDTDLLDVGDRLVERGLELINEEIPEAEDDQAKVDELDEKTRDCGQAVSTALADIEAGG